MAYKVDVFMVTYNHKEYIEKAINSVLAQRTKFNVRLVIADDCSTDGTRNILERYKKRYPEKIELILNSQNIGSQKNFAQLIDVCTSPYIALLDGDDYWIDDEKLQKQIDFLESNKECVICCHNTKVINEDGTEFFTHTQELYTDSLYEIDILFNRYFFHTSSAVFRNNLINSLPLWFYELPMGDYPLFLLIASHGKIAYINQIMSVYRKHMNGIWTGNLTSNSIINRINFIKMFYYFNIYTSNRFEENTQITIYRRLLNLKEELECSEGHFNIREEVEDLLFEIGDNISLKESNQSQEIIIFGTGIAAEKTYRLLNSLKINISYYLDNDPAKWGKEYCNKEIRSPEHFINEQEKNMKIIIASMYYNEISTQLVNLGFTKNENLFNFFEVELMLKVNRNNSLNSKLLSTSIIRLFNCIPQKERLLTV